MKNNPWEKKDEFGNVVEKRKEKDNKKRRKNLLWKSGYLPMFFHSPLHYCVNILLLPFYDTLYKEFANYHDYAGIR